MNCVLFAEMDQVFSLKIIDIKKILENGKKYWKSQGILSVQKSGNPVLSADFFTSKYWTAIVKSSVTNRSFFCTFYSFKRDPLYQLCVIC